MSQAYAIRSPEEARAYLAHPTLGPRLQEATEALLANDPSLTAEQILGGIDAIKVRSSMTLFTTADPSDPLFSKVLDRFYAAEPDPATAGSSVRSRRQTGPRAERDPAVSSTALAGCGRGRDGRECGKRPRVRHEGACSVTNRAPLVRIP